MSILLTCCHDLISCCHILCCFIMCIIEQCLAVCIIWCVAFFAKYSIYYFRYIRHIIWISIHLTPLFRNQLFLKSVKYSFSITFSAVVGIAAPTGQQSLCGLHKNLQVKVSIIVNGARSATRIVCNMYHTSVMFCSLAILNQRVDHTMDVLSPFISVRCHSDGLFHCKSCPRLDAVHLGHVFLACVHLALFLALSLFPGNSLVSSWSHHKETRKHPYIYSSGCWCSPALCHL